MWPKIKEAFTNEPALFIFGVAFGVFILVGILVDTFNPSVKYPTAWDKLQRPAADTLEEPIDPEYWR